jgi:hypothetical protein
MEVCTQYPLKNCTFKFCAIVKIPAGQLVGSVGMKCPRGGFEFRFQSPVRRLDISPTSGDLGEHCPSSAVGHVLCAPPGRVAQPRLLAKCRGNPAGAANRGRPLLVTFLGKTRKVTSCRATPDGVGFDSGKSAWAHKTCPPYMLNANVESTNTTPPPSPWPKVSSSKTSNSI